MPARDARWRPRVSRGILDAVGCTPLVELPSLSAATGCRILAKAEHLNPAGSVKDRPARALVKEAQQVPDVTTIVEGTGLQQRLGSGGPGIFTCD
jgi:cysteine synthase A